MLPFFLSRFSYRQFSKIIDSIFHSFEKWSQSESVTILKMSFFSQLIFYLDEKQNLPYLITIHRIILGNEISFLRLVKLGIIFLLLEFLVFSVHCLWLFRISSWQRKRKLRRQTIQMKAMTKLSKNTWKKSTMMKIVVCKKIDFHLAYSDVNWIKSKHRRIFRAHEWLFKIDICCFFLSFHRYQVFDVRHLSEKIFSLAHDEVSSMNHRYDSLDRRVQGKKNKPSNTSTSIQR